ncbi:Chaperone protein DnaK [Myxococcaceae bacterium]|jgi:hypothetical chaperone protein|nr:Chaperone protein DnaK [Myxococcaceae bacterium]
MSEAVGLDFGTTNSALAVAGASGPPRLARFGGVETFRSILYFHPEAREAGGRLVPFAGPAAISRYLEATGEGRLVQSLKSFLASRLFVSTSVFGTVVALETLIAQLLRSLRREAEADLGPLGSRVVVGRPVHFANAAGPDDEALALRRLRTALAQAGFRDVVFEYEPVAAAHHYEQGLARDELVLIGDFGGGTSDFSLLRLGPSFRGAAEREILATGGVALAGDAFDAKIVRHRVAPALGRGSEFRTLFGAGALPVPSWIYGHLERWHHLGMLKQRKNLGLLLDLRRDALDPEKLDALLHLVESDLGHHLYRAIETTKLALSAGESALFRFVDSPIDLFAEISRREFETWIDEEVRAVDACIDDLLARTAMRSDEIDRVFLTGGSSLVPAVRRLFVARFGEDRLRSGAELTSVASGLALRAREIGGN